MTCVTVLVIVRVRVTANGTKKTTAGIDSYCISRYPVVSSTSTGISTIEIVRDMLRLDFKLE